MRRLLPVTAVALVLLSGCIPFAPGGPDDYLTLDAEELLEPCTEVSDIEVETLASSKPRCEPVGSTLVFPDGGTIEVGPGLGATTLGGNDEKPRSYGYATVGIYGVVASTWLDDCEEFESWGRPEAIAKLEEVWGEFLGQC